MSTLTKVPRSRRQCDTLWATLPPGGILKAGCVAGSSCLDNTLGQRGKDHLASNRNLVECNQHRTHLAMAHDCDIVVIAIGLIHDPIIY